MDYKNIFITGATGVVGKPLLQKLKDHNHNIYALTRSAETEKSLKDLTSPQSEGMYLIPLFMNSWENMISMQSSM